MAERLPPTPMMMPARANTAATGAHSSEKGSTRISCSVSLLSTPRATAAYSAH